MFGSLKRKLALNIADNNKTKFKKNFTTNFFYSFQSVPIHLVSFSGTKFIWDQLYTIASFCTNVGLPLSWTIYSDGSYSDLELNLFNKVSFINAKIVDIDSGFVGKCYLEKHPFLRRLESYSKHPVNGTTIFCDSDILFFPKFKSYLNCLYSNCWFLPDENNFYFDSEYLEEKKSLMYGANGGLLIVNKRPNWDIALNYIKIRIAKQKALAYWSEQTAVHIMVTNSLDFFALDPRKFVIAGEDSFKIATIPKWEEIAIRHFVGPVRHKMWQTDWRKILNKK